MIVLAEELSIISGAQECVNVHLKPLLGDCLKTKNLLKIQCVE